MTPALDAMVAAMAAEFGRQAAPQIKVAFLIEGDHPEAGLWRLHGAFDLQKVARAGLAAIPVKSDALGRAVGLAMEREQLRNISVGGIWAVQESMIDAILKDDA